MSERFVNVDRDTPMLLPPSLQDWLPEGHLAHCVVETVTLLPLHGFKVNTRGTGSAHPDHDTVCAFRQQYAALFQESFVKVLEYARELGVLAQRGGVSVDGTKVGANASKHTAVSHGRAVEMIAELEREVQTLMALAEQADHEARPDTELQRAGGGGRGRRHAGAGRVCDGCA